METEQEEQLQSRTPRLQLLDIQQFVYMDADLAPTLYLSHC